MYDNFIFNVCFEKNLFSYLRDSLKIIDGSRICIWGKGYGAHVVGMMTAQDSLNLTRCSVAVAPIVTWAYHSKHKKSYQLK